jgi:hypothetical protein
MSGCFICHCPASIKVFVFPLFRSVEGIETGEEKIGEIAVVLLRSQPDEDRLSRLVYLGHQQQLRNLLIDAVLIDAKCVDPHQPLAPPCLRAKVLQSNVEVCGDGEEFRSIAVSNRLPRRPIQVDTAPYVRQSFVPLRGYQARPREMIRTSQPGCQTLQDISLAEAPRT